MRVDQPSAESLQHLIVGSEQYGLHETEQRDSYQFEHQQASNGIAPGVVMTPVAEGIHDNTVNQETVQGERFESSPSFNPVMSGPSVVQEEAAGIQAQQQTSSNGLYSNENSFQTAGIIPAAEYPSDNSHDAMHQAEGEVFHGNQEETSVSSCTSDGNSGNMCGASATIQVVPQEQQENTNQIIQEGLVVTTGAQTQSSIAVSGSEYGSDAQTNTIATGSTGQDITHEAAKPQGEEAILVPYQNYLPPHASAPVVPEMPATPAAPETPIENPVPTEFIPITTTDQSYAPHDLAPQPTQEPQMFELAEQQQNTQIQTEQMTQHFEPEPQVTQGFEQLEVQIMQSFQQQNEEQVQQTFHQTGDLAGEEVIHQSNNGQTDAIVDYVTQPDRVVGKPSETSHTASSYGDADVNYDYNKNEESKYYNGQIKSSEEQYGISFDPYAHSNDRYIVSKAEYGTPVVNHRSIADFNWNPSDVYKAELVQHGRSADHYNKMYGVYNGQSYEYFLFQ